MSSPPAEAPAAPLVIIACGALGGHVREILARRGWRAEVHCLPALLHNRPEKISIETERLARAALAAGKRVAVCYADCGTYGALDGVCSRLGLRRLPGLHCYDVLAGPGRMRAMFAAEPGTYVLTDFLVRSFRRTVLAGLGLDRYPQLWPDYFGHYRRLVWLAQDPTPELRAEAARVAALFGLPLTEVATGTGRLERELARLVSEAGGGVMSEAARATGDPGTGTRGGRGDRGDRGLASIARLLASPRYEVFPAGNAEQAVLEWVPTGMTVTVTASPGKGLDATIDLAERLAAGGYRVVPHLSARLVRDDAHLADLVARCLACGVDDVFVPAGDADPPAGRFESALSLLERLAELGCPFRRMGITGYPESHPHIGDDVTVQAMWDKRRYASYIVSNLCFDPATLQQFIQRVRARGVTLPLWVGMAPPIERARLLRFAARAGVAESARFLVGHKGWALRLGLPGGYHPDRLLARTAPTLAAPASAVDGLHLFTFNQLRQTEQWRRSLLARATGG